VKDANSNLEDAKLDALLSAKPVAASDDFTQNTVFGIRKDQDIDALDGWLDDLIENYPVEASDQFSADTLARIYSKPASVKPVSWFNAALASIGAIAALLIAGIYFDSTISPETRAEPSTQATIVASNQQTAPSAPAMWDMGEVLSLVDELQGAEALLDHDAYDALATFVN